MEYREIAPADLPELVKIFAETFNSEPWFENGRKKPPENAFHTT